MITVIAEIRTHTGAEHRQQVLASFAQILPQILAEVGCYQYQPLIDAPAETSFQRVDHDSIMMLEQWESVAHLQAHLQTAHMLAHQERVKDHVASVDIRILQDTTA